MTVLADLDAQFAVPELTVPVSLGASSARGYYDENGELQQALGLEIQVIGPVLFLKKDALAGLAEGQSVTVGLVGAASAVGGKQYLVHRANPIQDGLIIACQLGGGR